MTTVACRSVAEWAVRFTSIPSVEGEVFTAVLLKLSSIALEKNSKLYQFLYVGDFFFPEVLWWRFEELGGKNRRRGSLLAMVDFVYVTRDEPLLISSVRFFAKLEAGQF